MHWIRPVVAFACGFSLLLGTHAGGAELAVGDMAPQFELHGSDGRLYRLVDLLDDGGTDGVVLAWFPKAFTGG
jgi:peroxiredoxin Q/BCP